MSRSTSPDEDGERGAIVNTASVAAEDGQIGQVAYSSSKGGVVGMTLPLARDLAAVGIRVLTASLPGLIDTPIYWPCEASEEFKARLGAGRCNFPKRLGSSDEFADAGGRAARQQLHQRRGHPPRRRHPDAAQVARADPPAAGGSTGRSGVVSRSEP